MERIDTKRVDIGINLKNRGTGRKHEQRRRKVRRASRGGLKEGKRVEKGGKIKQIKGKCRVKEGWSPEG